jgi:hypothetical protein
MRDSFRQLLPNFFGACCLATVPSGVLAEPTSLYVQVFVDRNIECAATIMALGNGQQLASTVAGYFLSDAVDTLTTLGGWENRENADASILSQATVMAGDIMIGLSVGRSLQEQLNTQDECVLGVLYD